MKLKGLLLCVTLFIIGMPFHSLYADYKVYEDYGIPPESEVWIWPIIPGNFNGDCVTEHPPGQQKSFYTTSNGTTYTGWGVFFPSGIDLSQYYVDTHDENIINQYLVKFWVKTPVNLKVEIENTSGVTRYRDLDTIYNVKKWDGTNTWQEIWIPINWFIENEDGSFNVEFLRHLKSPFKITVKEGNKTFYIGNVRWVTPSQTISWDVSLKNIDDDAITNQITWQGVNPGDNWKVAQQYIEVHTDFTGEIDWGIQIYTENKVWDANPKYEGVLTQGFNLVSTDTHKGALPMCWKVKESKEDPTQPVWSDNRDDGTRGFADYQWKLIKDKSQTENPFINDEDYVKVWDNNGIYWNEGVGLDLDPYQEYFQPCPMNTASPNYIYLAANFKNATTPRTYKTNKLTLEMYFP